MNVELTIKKKDGSVEKYAPQMKYDKNNTVQIKMKLNKNTDADILEFLETVENRQGYLKELIRNDMNK